MDKFYDPSIDRYLEPEPLLQEPRYVSMMARLGFGVPAYAYALNNPLHFVDPTGRAASMLGVWGELSAALPQATGNEPKN